MSVEKMLQGYTRKLFPFEKGEHKSQQVLGISSRGQLLAFEHEDNILNESSAFKSQGNKLVPENPAELGLMHQCMMEGLTDKLSNIHSYTHNSRTQKNTMDTFTDMTAVKRNREILATELTLWEGYLQKAVTAGSYLAGTFSLTDVLSVGHYHKLAKYYSLLKDRASIKASWPPHWLARPQGYDILKDL
uniref:Uncharacterized protein n=1 Tax=Monopterus albus TaxID=43700 RepID=A0A3Q3JV95_MONAL